VREAVLARLAREELLPSRDLRLLSGDLRAALSELSNLAGDWLAIKLGLFALGDPDCSISSRMEKDSLADRF
jgi:hypothetical protein